MTTMRAGPDTLIGDAAHVRERLPNFELAGNGLRIQSLAALVRGEVIPRLLAAHVADYARPRHEIDLVTAEDAEAFATLALEVEADRLIAQVETILARGVSIETILVDVLAPAARILGEGWESDRCDFVAVTMGLWRLQQVVYDLAARNPHHPDGPGVRNHALFAAMPGDQHSFGTVVIDEVFRRAGWRTERTCEAETPALARRVADEWFDLVGLTVSRDCHIGALGSAISALRSVSRNPRLCVMVGGRVFGANPELAVAVGADGTAPDAVQALQLAAVLVRARQEEMAVCG